MAEHRAYTPPPPDSSTAQLLTRLSSQSSELVRHEVALAKVEIAEKTKGLGIGAGVFGVAGLLAFFGVATLVAAAVLGMAEALPAWLAALIVAIAVLALAGIAALLGKQKVAAGTPPVPTEAIENVKRDLAEVKEARHREH
ncbi:MAG TPA: phage holin family protein [Nocardioidaceae bacterium]|nr:phage holin family protein [Nocardioidaceae bacterium]